ncbi:hypothetical protein [Sedimentitalea todarodis]|uniref:Transposase n=1 Tax=Sedimentitalea todarodis TaxID=1631240 RepID=A0ABU3VM42_9RHOB|nr:hypothetical protein [Sedimentitalea todarodis]MDU9007168.1 hypothetical protein [Sedimentitalea todarodis]
MSWERERPMPQAKHGHLLVDASLYGENENARKGFLRALFFDD